MQNLIRAGLLASFACAAPLSAQTDDASAMLERARTQTRQLDFPAALDTLNAAITQDPSQVQAYLDRAALHRSMGRLSLAFDDIDAALAQDPTAAKAWLMLAETWRRADAPDRALATLDLAVATAPDQPDLWVARARAHAADGHDDLALSDFERALALAPQDATLQADRDALVARIARESAPQYFYAPNALMDPAFLVTEGADTAPNAAVFVHDGGASGADATPVDRDLVNAAIDAGQLSVVHLFTYSGKTSSIWGNLALICAGSNGYRATAAALRTETGRAALAAIDTTGDTAPLRGIIADSYAAAGLDPAMVSECALDRGFAVRYLADWNAKSTAIGWHGTTFFDVAPAYVLNDTPVAPAVLNARLAALVPGIMAASVAEVPAPATAVPSPVQDAPAAATQPADMPEAIPEPVSEPAPQSVPPAITTILGASLGMPGLDQLPQIDADVATRPWTLAPPRPAAAPESLPETLSDLPGLPSRPEAPIRPMPRPTVERPQPIRPMPRPTDPEADPAPAPVVADTATPDVEPDADASIAETQTPPEPAPAAASPAEDVRLASILKGIWAPNLVGCLAYLDQIETPTALDQAMPPEAEDSAGIGLVLVTSRRVKTFDGTGRECLAQTASTDGDDLRATLACGTDTPVEMELHAYPTDLPVPALDITLNDLMTPAMRQCLTLGQLGVRFADLWQIDDDTCTASAPLRDALVTFQPDDKGGLQITLRPTGEATASAESFAVDIAVDDVTLPAGPGQWSDGRYSVTLGGFAEAARHLSLGMFLFVTPDPDLGQTALRLPLLGSGRAMTALQACAPSAE